ncbi:MAG: hypothetical protein M0T70_14150 [Geobacteraceae bacterium]|nr:hypothetical protein [Geobacteraceae bacterium]
MHRDSLTIAAIRTAVLLFVITIFLSSCATIYFERDGKELPPILAQDEIIRPYVTLGRIQTTADMSFATVPNLQEWGFRTLREEASKMGADAVMLPEVTSYPTTYLFFPGNEYRATGMAIKFK